MRRGLSLVLLLCALGVACGRVPDGPIAIDFQAENLYERLAPLGRSIGDSRIVLLGENGHGVGEFSEAKVELVQWLHSEHGFDVVAFESGFFECAHVWERIDSLRSEEALLACLRYPLQHAQLVPLFERIRASRGSDRPLVLAGMDIQAQGFDSERRPRALHEVLNPMDPSLADRIAAIDSALFLLPRHGGLGDAVYAWAAENGEAAKRLYDSAAAITTGQNRWVFRLATGWIDRLAVRGEAEASSEMNGRPAEYYELRDRWMARALSALADSIGGKRKVVAWLHNDHARYGDFENAGRRIRSVGGFLRDLYGREVYSIGFFMGQGTITDNGRTVREVAVPDSTGVESFLHIEEAPASVFILRGSSSAAVRDWAAVRRPYLRMGLEPRELVPEDEFDALVYIHRVRPPRYDVRRE